MTARNKVYFISDLHLGATYIPDQRAHERAVVEWLDSIASDACELYMLGDILDYWYEYRTVVPRGYIRFFGALARLSDAGVRIVWFTGNHDIWLFDYLRGELGIEVVDGPLRARICGVEFFMAHGDGVGRLPRSFRFLRALFRNRLCQKLYASIHPRWTIPFAHRWSTSSRDYSPEVPVCADPGEEPLVKFAAGYAASHPGVKCMMFGHRHLLLAEQIGKDAYAVILGDWIHHFSWAELSAGGHLDLWQKTQEGTTRMVKHVF